MDDVTHAVMIDAWEGSRFGGRWVPVCWTGGTLAECEAEARELRRVSDRSEVRNVRVTSWAMRFLSNAEVLALAVRAMIAQTK